MSLQMERDPFARVTTVRHIYPYPRSACAWCGDTHKRHYRYTRVSDGGTSSVLLGAFCNKQCRDAYHCD